MLSWLPLVMVSATVDFTPQNPSTRFSFNFGSFSDKPPVPRSKPRLGKTGRRHVARANPGLNPSEPCLVDHNRATDDVKNGLSDGFVFGKSETSPSFSKKPPIPRSKPRLGKMRRRHVARANPGLNPSEPCLVDHNRANDDVKNGLSDGSVFGKSETSPSFSNKPPVPRSKLRLRKTRRRHVARANPGLNPAEPCLDNLSRATDDVKNGLSDWFVFGKSETRLNNPNLNVEMKQSNTSFLNSNTDYKGSNENDESGRFVSKGFVSGAESVSDCSYGFVFGPSGASLKNPNLNVEMKQSNTSFSNSNTDYKGSNENEESGSFMSKGFVSGAARSCYNLKNRESISGLSNGFVFGTSGLENPNLNVEMEQNNDVFSNSNSECEESDKNDDFGKFLSGGFVFGTGKRYSSMGKTKSGRRNPCRVRFGFDAKGGVLNSDSNSTKETCGEKMENLTHETKGNAEIGCERGDGLGFVFSGNWCELGSTSDKTRSLSNENGEKSVPVDSEHMKPGVPGEVDNRGFVFGSTSISGSQKVFENVGEMKEDAKLGLEEEKVDNVFVFGSINKGNSFLRDHNKFADEMNKRKAEDCRNNFSVDNDIHKSGFFVNNKQNFVFGSNFSDTHAPAVSTSDNLSDEMKKLSVDESKEMGKFDSIKDPFTNSCAGSDPVFVFGSSGKPSCSNTGRSGTTKIKDAKSQGPEKTDGIDIRISNNDKTEKTGGGVSDEQIKLSRVFETFEEKHPSDANERSSNDTSVGVSTPTLFTSQAGPDGSFVRFEYQGNDDPKLEKTFGQNLFSAGLFHVEGFSIGRVEGKDNFCFMSTAAGVGSSATGFRMPNIDTSCSFAENTSTSFSRDPDCNKRGISIRNRKWKKLSRRFRKADPSQRQRSKNNEGSQQNAESPGQFSPMDFSPYQNDQCAPSTNATSSGLASDESARKEADTGRGEKYFGQAHEFSKNFWERFAAEYAFEQAETVGGSPRTGQINTSNDDNDGGVADSAFPKFSKQEENESRNEFCFPSSTDGNERNTGFPPISKEDNVSATKYRSRKKYRIKVGCGPNNIDTQSQVDSGYLDLNQTPSKERYAFESQRKVKNNVEGDEEHGKQPATTAAQNSCEKWRIRGNQAYEEGNSSKAEEYYTKGINSFTHKGSPDCSTEPLVLCYSNRAAARMLCGRLREALADCVMADSLDPSFQKVQLRAANCHLALGETEEACQYFSKCLESKGDVCLDRRIAIEAASGLQKAQKLASCINHCAELLRQKTSTAANSALENISVVFPTSSYSEKLLELKGEAFLRLQRYKEVIQLCEQTLVSAEKNFAMATGDNNSVYIDAPNSKNSTMRLWRWRLMSKSYFYLGKLEVALDLLEKQEVLASSDDSRSNIEELSFPFAATVRELLHQRTAGNRAFQSGRYTEAVEHYSAAVSSSIESRPFAAICFCNRAAAQEALGQLSDAISDCSIAIALDGSYSKAVSRRATLHEKIRDYASATSDLERLVSLLKEQSKDNNCGSAAADSSSGNNVEELRKARRRLSSMEEKVKKGLALDHYLILGVKSTDEASEIKKAYRKAALRHHPDKAAQFLARGDNGDDGRLWKEICEEIQKDADRLFKTIGEAYAVLSDPNKRSEYDLEEELRNARKDGNRNQDSTGPFNSYSTPFRNRSNSRYSQESWKTYGYSRSQW